MIIGWLRRRAEDRRELEELRAFADEMSQYLDNVDLLLQLAEEEDEIPVTTEGMWKPEYIKSAFSRYGSKVLVESLAPRLRIQFPEPEVTAASERIAVHHAVRFRCDWAISDQELMLRRSAGEMAALIARVNRDMQETIDRQLHELAAMPIDQARKVIMGARA